MPASHALARNLLLRALGICLVATFWCLLEQTPGLIGSHGITPLGESMQVLRQRFGGVAPWAAPTLFWLSTADAFVQAVLWSGLAAGACLVVGVAPRAACAVAYAVQLSLYTCEPAPLRWFNLPFDDLMIETSFVAMLVAPRGLFVAPWRLPAGRPWQRWLLLWILFRLVFGCGLTKLAAGGSWTGGTGVELFLATQPFPTAAAMWVADLPPWTLRAMTGFALVAEVLAPLCYCWPGRVQRLAGATGILLMLGIQLCGNFRGFNLLTVALLLFLFDDRSLSRWLPRRWRERLHARIEPPPPPSRAATAWAALWLALIGLASIAPVAAQLRGHEHDDLPLATLRAPLGPLHLAANYYMFCHLPAQRFGIVIQGSDDGVVWRDYELPALVGAERRAPVFVAPGTDWLGFALWLAGNGPPEVSAAWLSPLLRRLQAGEPTVRALFTGDPFPDAPPRHTRAALFRFRFADADERRSGRHWRREFVGVHTAGP